VLSVLGYRCGTTVKPIRQSKNAYIQMLLARGLNPRAKILHAELSAEEARTVERRLIAENRCNAWNCNTADGGEGIVPGVQYSVYALCEPWHDGRIFYIGIAADVKGRLKAHIAEAKETCLVLTRSPNMARFLADFLNGCPNTSAVLDGHAHESPFKTFFFRTPDDYLKTWGASDCTAEGETVRVGKWLMHGRLSRRDFVHIVAAFERVGGLFDSKKARRRSKALTYA
jgi:hypothetical protein